MKQLLNWVGGMERLLHGVGWCGAVKLGFPRSLGGSQPLDGVFAGFRCRAVFVIIILEFTKYEIDSVNIIFGVPVFVGQVFWIPPVLIFLFCRGG